MFNIISSCYNGIILLAYEIQDEEGNIRVVPENKIVSMIKANKINNAEYINDKNIEGGIIYVKDRIQKKILNNKNIKLTYRIKSNNKCIGYKAKDMDGKVYTLSINKTWELAVNNCIKGVKGMIVGGKKAIISSDKQLLSNLPILDSNEPENQQ